MSIIETKISLEDQLLNTLGSYPEKVGFVKDEILTQALKFVEENLIPDAKHEEYKYCNVQALLKKNFKSISRAEQAITRESVSPFFLKDAINIVVLNGKINSDLSDNYFSETDIQISSIQDISSEIIPVYFSQRRNGSADYFEQLCIAFSGRGIFLQVNSCNENSSPIHLLHVNSAGNSATLSSRNLILVKQNTRLKLVESFYTLGESSIFFPSLTEIHLEKQSYLEHFRLQNQGDYSFHVNNTFIHQAAASRYSNHTFTLSGEMVRNNLHVSLAGENSETQLNGLFITSKNQLVDNHTVVDHQVPNCNSNELYKGILAGKSTGVFNGKIFVQRDAQKTNAYQSSKNILLSDDASINTKPQLEIYADDVKCSHGTSTGMIDEEALFYLKSRGIGDNAAKKLLLLAFGAELFDELPSGDFADRIKSLFESTLNENL